MKKKNCLIVMLMILLLLFSACGKKAEVKGDEIFSCNPDNLLGLESVYIDDGKMFICFDDKYVYDEEYPYGVQGFFKNGKLNNNNYVGVIIADGDPVLFEGDDVAVDADELTLSFSIDGLDSEKINGVSFAIGDRYRVDFEAGTINGDCYGGDCTVYYEQTYNTEFSSWGAAKSETVGEPETCEP